MDRKYSRVAAIQYAFTYAKSYNRAYADLSGRAGNGGGGDCNNFVSQALFAGGWPMTDSLFFSAHWPANWWYRRQPTGSKWEHYFSGYASTTWANPDFFYKFLFLSGRAVLCDESDLRPGDIVQAAHMPERAVIHTMIVTTKRSNDVGLTYHTNDTLDASFNKVTKQKFGSAYSYVCFTLLDTFQERDPDEGGDRD
jgi:hypothetical protein